jgi:uncharacterized ferritin-like protein (DUF455 family)
MTPRSLTAAIRTILNAAAPVEKVALSHRIAAEWRDGTICEIGNAVPPERPARPEKPELKDPRDMPRRRGAGSLANRVALLHAVAHIELNAIDLAWDLVARFASADLPRDFFDDWVTVAEQEATHHALVAARLEALGSAYGDLPAHDGLWQAAQATAHDLLARLAIVPLVLEARGLDVTPEMIEKLRRQDDAESVAALETIYREEVEHVAAGARWFRFECTRRRLDPVETYRELVRRYHRGGLKPPFNRAARDKAGFSAAFYENV